MITSINKITGVGILDKSDIDVISSLSDQLKDTFENKELMRTEFLARTSVLNDTDFPDPNSKFWQSIREQDMQLTALVNDSFTYEKTLAEIEILEVKRDQLDDTTKLSKANKKLKQIEIDEKRFMIINLKLNAHHRVRELALWEKLKQEQIKIDPSFDRRNPETNQPKSFRLKWEKLKSIATTTSNGSLYRSVTSHLDSMGDQK